ncbi:MAG: universal stress protein [Maribacter sp.]|nr:universal stress protein [Maribacter sp.]
MKKILFCTDLSENCKGVVQFISDWISGSNYIVDVAHAYDPNMVTFSSINIIKSEDIQKEMIQKMQDHLKDYLNGLPAENRGNTHLIADSSFSDALIEKAKALEVDLIITGLRQKYTLLDRFFGSTAAHMVSDSSIPLMVVPYLRNFETFDHIVFPTAIGSRDQLTEAEEDALGWIYENLKSNAQRKLHLVHIEDDKEAIELKFEHYPFSQMDFTRSYSPDVAAGIIDYLNAHDVDLLAIYRPAKNIWEKIYKSSVAKKLLFKSHLPILFL